MPDGRADGKPGRSKGRHAARKRAIDLLFEAEARGLTAAEVADSRTLLANSKAGIEPLNPYTETVARGVTENAAHIDDLISSHLQGWTAFMESLAAYLATERAAEG